MHFSEETALRPNDVDYARDIFAELVIALTLQRSNPLSTSEAEALAVKALNMAKFFGDAQQRSTPTHEFALARIESPKEPLSLGSSPTFAQIAQEWIGIAVKRSAGRSRRELKSRFERYVLPHLGARPIGEIEPREILSVIRSIESAGYLVMAYATFRDLRFMYRYALAAGLSNSDPTATLRRAITKPRHKGTNMITDPDSVGRLLLAMRQYKGQPRSTARYMLRLLPMVFLRASELRTLEWRDVDLDAATIVVPTSRMKMRRPHVVPLARQAMRILRDVQKMTGSGRYVFTGGREIDKPLHFSMFHFMFGVLGYRRVVSAHGFRVLASTWLNEQGWPAEVIERQLSHLGGDRTRRLYNHAEYLAQRRRMMQEWADHLESLECKANMPLHVGRSFRCGDRTREAHHAAV